jgi:hypothetical protein
VTCFVANDMMWMYAKGNCKLFSNLFHMVPAARNLLGIISHQKNFKHGNNIHTFWYCVTILIQ